MTNCGILRKEVVCSNCGAEVNVSMFAFKCPKCGGKFNGKK